MSSTRLPAGWNSGTVTHDGASYYFQALVFSEGSRFGIDGGRVSKLAIVRADALDWRDPVYNYDRGEDVDQAPAGLVAAVLARIGR